jgi:beta-glucanase (GH16 family)/predicted Ser/Thr protein kinase
MNAPVQSQTATVVIPPAPSHPASSATPDEGRFVPGTLVAGRYRIISLLGRGGMGEVYRATDLTLSQPVALKFLPDSGADHQRNIERFHDEVRIARQVSHPNVCRVYDVGEAEGMPYISMEYVDGEDLASLLQRIGRLPADKALEIARKICAGVAAAHDKGVIHRDLKPANIMLDRRGNVVVMDFGLAAVTDQLRGAEARSGTPAYMAPEQLRGEQVTARSDIYALGMVLYEIFTGKRAYDAATMAELIRLQESGQITSMSSIAAEIDPAVEKAIRRCLDPDPAKRPATALSVAAALPGGDPLAAALAAGETPSPELVAASGETEGLPLAKSVPLALALAALIIAVPFARTNVELHSMVPFELSPDALAAKVREHAAAFGYTAPPADKKYDLHWDGDLIGDAGKHVKTVAEARRWFEAEPPLRLGYRESPLPLIAPPDGEVTEERPAPDISGMIEAWVTSKGELRFFHAAPPELDRPAPARPVDVQTISRAIGFDISQWPETIPRFTPRYAFDWQKAWNGQHPTLHTDLTVQAAAWQGKIVDLQVLAPWSKPWHEPVSHVPDWRQTARMLGVKIIYGLVFLFSAFMAARNLRGGRGDRRGAWRLSVAFFILMGAAWVCTAHWVADISMIEIFLTNVADWFMSAALIWLLYIALEPAVRARWPHAILTWSRVLAGRWQDPQVAAHILYGALVGLIIDVFFLATNWFQAAHGSIGGMAAADVGVSTRYFIAQILNRTHNAAEFGLILVFAIFCFRAVFRKDWIASAAAAVVFTLMENDVWNSSILNFLLFLLIFTLLVFVLLRLGLVSTMAAIFFINVLLQTPGAQNLTKPYESAVVLYPAVALAIVIWAFWRTSGRQLLTVDGKTGLLACLLAICCLTLLPSASAQDRQLIWSDEFNGAPGSPPDPAKWAYDLRGGGWGNQELEVYADSRANSHLDGQGHLVIQALQPTPGKFTSARLKTQGKFAFEYGRVEARIRIPYGQGIWPAFWMLGADIQDKGWPTCGEIDIMENIGREPDTVHGTVHGPGYSGDRSISKPFQIPAGRFADDYHVYAVDWTPDRIDFLVDGQSYHTVTPASLPTRTKWVYDHPFFLILNVAVGGMWPGNPDKTSEFPQTMLVDYVRVYR